MPKKTILSLLALAFLLIASLPVYADTAPAASSGTQNSPSSTSASTSSGPFSALTKNDSGIRPIKPMDLNAMGNKAVNFGNQSYAFLLKGSIPLFVWAIGGSVLLLLLGIFFGKRVILAGVTGIIISLIVVVLIHYLPEIVVTVKNAAGGALAP